MPRRKEQFENGDICHVILRAIDDNLLFKNTDDYYRGIFSIYEFNNGNPVNIRRRRENRKKEKITEPRRARGSAGYVDNRDRLVDVLAFCFMPNHIHLLLKQTKDNGISKFMQKLGGGYGRYFNDKYKRKGHVFQDSYKLILIEDDKQLLTVAPYIFTNPIALIEPEFKEKGIRVHSSEEIIKFLEDYKWSSYQDYIGVKNFDSVTQRDFLLETIGGAQGCKDIVAGWISRKKDLGQFSNLYLE
ncbi:MAG: transposase [Candidatus Staskawiczbacteria bacterium]|nr:transposase [Candidatus Staskawiczbacteria bacterium]